jgi:CheY-like chemotaxis protein
VLAAWLAEAGYVVEEASLGSEALRRVRAGGVDLVLVDVDLPDQSGLALCQALKASPVTRSVAVVELSATYVDSAHRTAGLQSGAECYLVEPLSRDELVASVEAVLRNVRARREAERLAARLERLNVATLEMGKAEGLAALVEACAEQLAAVLEAAAVVVASADGQAVLAHADRLGASKIDQMLGTPSALEASLLPAPDVPYTIVAEEVGPGVLGLEPGQAYRVVTVASPRGGAHAIIGAELERVDEHTVREVDLVLRQLGRALGVALDNLHVLRVERSLALQLQHSLLPTTLPEIEGLEIAARYVASSEHAELGGDFFEVIELAKDRVGIAIGDVQGHSIEAAAVMAGVRHWVHAYAFEGHRPGEVLERVNALFLRSYPELTATVCYSQLELSSGRLVVANAGHVPLLVSGRSGVRFCKPRGTLLGVEGPPPDELELEVEVGMTLVWVTDGLLERRGEPLGAGLDRLAGVVAVATAPGSPEPLDRLCDRLLGLVGIELGDDVALVACRITRLGSRNEARTVAPS